MAMVMQDSDSIYVGMLFVLLFLFEMFCNDLNGLKRFFLMLTIAFLAMQTMGLIQILFAGQMVKLSSTVTTVCQGSAVRIAGLIILGIWLCLELFSSRLPQEKLPVVNRFIHLSKRVLLVLAGLTILVLIAMIILVTNFSDSIDFGSLSKSKYFMFNDAWGTWRGMNWSTAVTSYGELNLWQKLFGIGPDCYYPYVNAYHADFTSRWSSAICNAHNEFLTALVDVGLLGAICYYGLFISLLWSTYKQKKKKPLLLAFAAGIVGFLFNNLFSFMNIISTPLLFTVAGYAAALLRNNRDR
jgi:O-antigen ligase